MKQSGSPLYPLGQLETIWSIVEARKTFPTMIVVTSATSADDTGSIARGLAQVAHAAGQRTGYLQLHDNGPSTPSAPYARLSVDARGSLRGAFDTASASWRELYDVVVVDAATFGSESLGAHVARVSAGVVVAICERRRVVPADRDLARILGELGASLIGVVMTARVSDQSSLLQSRNQSPLRAAAQTQ